MSDDSQMNLTALGSETSLLSALSTVAELKTNLNQLSELIHTENIAACSSPSVYDQSISMQIDPEATKVADDSSEKLVHSDLKTIAYSILNASTEVIKMLQSHRKRVYETAEDVEVRIIESELAYREAVENEVHMLRRNVESDDSENELITVGRCSTSSVSPFNRTSVFEVLEREVKHSADELERANAEFQLERAQFSEELNIFKEKAAILKQENEELKANLLDLNQQWESDGQRNSEVISQLRAEHDRIHEKWERQLNAAQDHASRLQLELEEVRQQGERECHTWRSKHTKLQAELKELADRHIPSNFFPWIADVPGRISQYLTKMETQCPWLPSILAKSNTTAIPNPEFLRDEYDTVTKQLTADRDHLQEQLTQVTTDLSSMRLLNTEQTERIEQLEKQARIDKSDLVKLKRNVLRYQDYLVQLLDPKHSAHALSTINQRIHNQPAQSSGTSFPSGQDIHTVRSPSSSVTSFSSTLGDELGYCHKLARPAQDNDGESVAFHVSPAPSGKTQSPVSGKPNGSTATSPSVLSRMTAAVSAFANAIMSPRRTQPLPAPEPATVQMQDLSKSHKTSQGRSPLNENAVSEKANSATESDSFSRPCNQVSPGTVSATPFTRVSSSTTGPQASSGPVLVSTDTCTHLKSKTMGEVEGASAKERAASSGAIVTSNPSEWASFPWKHKGSEPAKHKLSTIEGTSAICDIQQKHLRSEPERPAFAVPAAPVINRAPTLKRKPLGEIPITSAVSERPASIQAPGLSNGSKWEPIPWKSVDTESQPKKEPEYEIGAFFTEGPLAESTAGPFRLPIAHPPSAVVHKRARIETGTPFLLEGPLAESTSGPYRPPSLAQDRQILPAQNDYKNSTGHTRPHPEPAIQQTVSSKPKRANLVDAQECAPS